MKKAYQILAGLAVASVAGTLNAAPIVIDHDGTGPLAPVLTNTWDWQPGNSLATSTTGGTTTVGGNRAVSNAIAGNGVTSFDLLYQARMATVIDQLGLDIIPVKNQLNVFGSGFEITVVAGFKEDVALVAGGTVIFSNPAQAGLNYFEIYFDKLDGNGGASSTGGVASNNLTGEGFNDGRLIAKGNITVVNSLFSALNGVQDLDTFGGTDNYPGPDTINGQGVTTLIAGAEISEIDPTFFPNIVANQLGADLTFELFTSTQTTPFATADPSSKFVFAENGALVGTQGAGPAPVVSGAGLGAGNMSLLGLGTINGAQPAGVLGGESIQFQADASNTFLARQDFGIPEPASAALGLMGLAAIGLRRRRTA